MIDEQINLNNLSLNLCPGCGAPVDVEPGKTTVHCKYCNNTFTIPSYLSAENFKSPQNEKGKEFIDYIKNGDKANAIRLYMQMTNTTLPLATKIVDKLSSHYSPFSAKQDKPVKVSPVGIKGFVIIIISLILAISLLIFFLTK